MFAFLIFVSFILGLIFFKGNIFVNIICIILFITYLIYRFRNKKVFYCLAVLTLGIFISKIDLSYNADNNQYLGIVIESKENYFIFQSRFEKFYVYEENSEREIGDCLLIESKAYTLESTSYESRFDFNSYLNDKGIKRQLYSTKIEVKFAAFLRLKVIKENYLSNYNEPSKALLSALLFADQDYDSSAMQLASELNIIFLFSLSGIYLSCFINVIKKVLSLFIKKELATLIPILFLFPLMIFVFPKVGPIRAYIMAALTLFNKVVLKNKFSRLTLISLLGLTFLIIDYHLVYQSSFYIGFSMSIFMVFIKHSLSRFRRVKRQLLYSLFAFAFILPFSSLLVYKWYIFTPIFQYLLTPLNQIYLFFGIISFYISLPFNHLIPFLSNFIVYSMGQFTTINFAIYYNSIFDYFIPIYYALLIYIVQILEQKRIYHVKLSSLSLVSCFLLCFIPIKIYISNSIYFINVGQGDSILIQNKNNIVMIDTGGNKSFDMAQEVLIPFLHKKEIRHIDALITTHNDYDHAGAANSLISNFKVHNFYTCYDFTYYQIGDIKLENLNHYTASDENDKSLVFNLSFLSSKWLLMGDASVNVENYLLESGANLDCDYLKVGHHGSKTSTSEEFLKAATPKEAIISVGKKNSYGHPNKEVLARLNKYNVKIRRTDLEGTICYSQYTFSY